jgi:hypothetical protein
MVFSPSAVSVVWFFPKVRHYWRLASEFSLWSQWKWSQGCVDVSSSAPSRSEQHNTNDTKRSTTANRKQTCK